MELKDRCFSPLVIPFSASTPDCMGEKNNKDRVFTVRTCFVPLQTPTHSDHTFKVYNTGTKQQFNKEDTSGLFLLFKHQACASLAVLHTLISFSKTSLFYTVDNYF